MPVPDITHNDRSSEKWFIFTAIQLQFSTWWTVRRLSGSVSNNALIRSFAAQTKTKLFTFATQNLLQQARGGKCFLLNLHIYMWQSNGVELSVRAFVHHTSQSHLNGSCTACRNYKWSMWCRRQTTKWSRD